MCFTITILLTELERLKPITAKCLDIPEYIIHELIIFVFVNFLRHIFLLLQKTFFTYAFQGYKKITLAQYPETCKTLPTNQPFIKSISSISALFIQSNRSRNFFVSFLRW